MILKHNSFSFDIDTTCINTIIVENPKLYRQLFYDFNNQSNNSIGNFHLFADFNEVDINKHLYLMNNPFNEDLNNRKIINQLYNMIAKEIQVGFIDHWQNLISHMHVFADEIIDLILEPLDYQANLDIKDFLKFIKLQFSFDRENLPPVERFIEHIKLIKRYFHPESIVLFNLQSFFLADEWNLIYRNMQLEGINAIFFERTDYDIHSKTEKVYIIDRDLCEIY